MKQRTKETLTSPVIITPRLQAGLQVGQASWVSVEPSGEREYYGKTGWKYTIDTPDFSYTGSDIFGPANSTDALETFLSFALACIESLPDGEHADMFPQHVTPWLDDNAHLLENLWLSLQPTSE